MALDLALLALPKEVEKILNKPDQNLDSEYLDIIFSLPNAFQEDFQDFGHTDWIEFKKDAQDLAKYYPEKKFDPKFYININRMYGVFDYLIAQVENAAFDSTNFFFYNGIEFSNCKSSQGFSLMYWDIELLQKKKNALEALSFEQLYRFYDFNNMIHKGVYKIDQLNGNVEELRNLFIKIKQFLDCALKLKGYVFVLKD